MAVIHQHIPNFVSGIPTKAYEFEELNELKKIPFVKRLKSKKDFYQFSISEKDTLMVEFNDGYEWYVVGYIDGITRKKLGLPKWKPKY